MVHLQFCGFIIDNIFDKVKISSAGYEMKFFKTGQAVDHCSLNKLACRNFGLFCREILVYGVRQDSSVVECLPKN